MKIEQQCCTLDQAKRLNELGVKQGLSIFFYDEFRERLVYNNSPTGGYFNSESCFSAFTVAELGMMLPINISITKGQKWHCRYWLHFDITDILRQKMTNNNWHQTKGENLSSILADMLLFLLENNLITPEQVNKQLTPLKGE